MADAIAARCRTGCGWRAGSKEGHSMREGRGGARACGVVWGWHHAMWMRWLRHGITRRRRAVRRKAMAPHARWRECSSGVHGAAAATTTAAIATNTATTGTTIAAAANAQQGLQQRRIVRASRVGCGRNACRLAPRRTRGSSRCCSGIRSRCMRGTPGAPGPRILRL